MAGDQQEKNQKPEKPSRLIHDGQKIDSLVKSKGEKQKAVWGKLNPIGNNKGGYRRIVKEQAALGLADLQILAGYLGVNVRDLVKDEYQDDFPFVEIVPLQDDNATQEKMIALESEYGGRVIVLNSFPSMIYLHTGKDSDPRYRRHRLLMGKNDGNTEIINTEYYL